MNFIMKYRMKRVAKGIGGLLLIPSGLLGLIDLLKQNDFGEIGKWGVIARGVPIPAIFILGFLMICVAVLGLLLIISAVSGRDTFPRDGLFR